MIWAYGYAGLLVDSKNDKRPGEGMLAHAIAGELSEAVAKDEADGGIDIASGLYGKETSKWVRKIAKLLAEKLDT